MPVRRRLSWLTPEIAWVFALFLPILIVKLACLDASHVTRVDGTLYLEVARHVRDGEGLSTRMSLYNQGFTEFPHASSLYPLFPLVVGYLARLFPLFETGVYVAGLGYLASLLGMYFWGARLFPRELFPSTLPGLNAGHVGMLMLAIVKDYYMFTSLPYTDGVAAAIALWGSYRAIAILPKPTIRGGIELGVWSVLAFLARSQLVLFPLSLGLTLLYGLGSRHREWRAFLMCGLALCATFVVLSLPHAFHVASGMEHFKLNALLEFQNARENDLLSKLELGYKTDGALDYLKDRAAGVVIAYSPGQYAYQKQFHQLHWLLPVALLFVFLRGLWAVVQKRARPATRAWLQLDLGRVQAVLMASIAFLLVHHVHKTYNGEWIFHRRHAALCLLIFWLAFVYLTLHARFVGKALGVILLSVSLWSGASFLQDRYRDSFKDKELDQKPALAAFLEKEAKSPHTVAYEPWSQSIGMFTRNVNYHWVEQTVTLARDFDLLAERFGVTYVVLSGARPHRFAKKGATAKFNELFVFDRKLDGLSVYKRRKVATRP